MSLYGSLVMFFCCLINYCGKALSPPHPHVL